MSPTDRPDAAAWIGRTVRVVVDRPLGSRHPEFGWVYPVNYGYIPGVFSADGAELDAYVLGADGPLAACDGSVVAVVQRRDDVEDKLVVAVAGDWNAGAITDAVAFQEQFFDSEVRTS